MKPEQIITAVLFLAAFVIGSMFVGFNASAQTYTTTTTSTATSTATSTPNLPNTGGGGAALWGLR